MPSDREPGGLRTRCRIGAVVTADSGAGGPTLMLSTAAAAVTGGTLAILALPILGFERPRFLVAVGLVLGVAVAGVAIARLAAGLESLQARPVNGPDRVGSPRSANGARPGTQPMSPGPHSWPAARYPHEVYQPQAHPLPAGAPPAGVRPSDAPPTGAPTAGFRPSGTQPTGAQPTGVGAQEPGAQPGAVALPIPHRTWWATSTSTARRTADPLSSTSTASVMSGSPWPPDDAAGLKRIVQCPECGGFRIDVRQQPPDFAFSCARCGHRWSWRPGTGWPRTMIRPIRAREHPSDHLRNQR